MEDIIIHECTPLHPLLALMKRYLDETHIVSSYVRCPSDVNEARTRRRRFTTAISRTAAMAVEPVHRGPMELARATQGMFDPSIFFCAPEAEV